MKNEINVRLKKGVLREGGRPSFAFASQLVKDYISEIFRLE